jgi:UDP-3-O-[3-hydroxymyristoyl] glucosamine N-acyltransferase
MKNLFEIKISDVVTFLDSKDNVIENTNLILTNFNSIDSAKKGEISFYSSDTLNNSNLLENTNASLIICSKKLRKNIKNKNFSIIFVSNPRLDFLRCVKKFLPINDNLENHSSSIILTNKIGKNFSIGPFSYISKNVIIGNNVRIYGNVFIYDNVIIGNNVTINASTVIGTDGFGYERNSDMELEKFPHIGGVQIQDNVEIGSNTCIDKGTLEKTIIGKGTKIDNLVHIAHNVKIGQNCAIIANSLIGGSCIIKNNVYISMSSTIRDKITIGNNAIIGMGSVVTKDVSKNSTVFGVPAKLKQ